MSPSDSDHGEAGWFWPTGARKAHFDPGNGDGIALCGKWGRFSPVSPSLSAPLDGNRASPPSRDDCATCRKRLEAGG